MSVLFRTAPATGVAYSVLRFPSDLSDPASVSQTVTSWLDSPEMVHLLDRFGRRLTADTVEDRLAEAELVTRDIFDFRRGGERWEAEPVELDPATVGAIERAVSSWFVEPAGPPQEELGPVTHALVLGGRINSCLLRSELLDLLVGRGLRPGAIWGLGSDRRADEGEREIASTMGVGSVETELDAMCVALSWAFGIDQAGVTADGVRRFDAGPVPMAGLTAAAPTGARRATTSDTYRFFRSVSGGISSDDHLLVVTSAIHAPFQHAQALAELSLRTGAHIRTVGAHIGTSSTSMVRDLWTPGEWLQEIRSAIWSLHVMYTRLLDHHPGLRGAGRTTST